MFRLTLAQMRRSLGRLTAAGIAIVIGTAFVAATLIAGAVITRTSYDAVAASYADADFVVTPAAGADGLTAAQLGALRDVPGVVAVDGRLPLWVELASGDKRVVHEVIAVASNPRLGAQRLVAGAMPAGDSEIALPQALADRLGARLGSVVTVDRSVPERLSVVGLVDDPSGAFAQSGGAVVAWATDAARWAEQDAGGADVAYASAVVAVANNTVADGAEARVVRAALTRATSSELVIRTTDEQAAAITRELTNGTDVFTSIVLGFAAIALLVAALVIANTFQVLIAQRTRTLALLRCVGADKRQLRRSVLLEAGILGVAASTLGLALGVGVAQLALVLLGRANLDVPLPGTVSITPAVVLAPLVVGVAVTVLAALAPARAATRVSPLAALRPPESPESSPRRNRPRALLSGAIAVGGTSLLVAAAATADSIDALASLGLGVLGGALSFVGAAVGSVFWVPRIVSAAGRLLAPIGPAAKLAAANTARNPRRTAATSTALLIGVTLVAMMSTGAASARATLDAELDDQFPVDVAIDIEPSDATAGGSAQGLAAAPLLETVAQVPGVGGAVALHAVDVTIDQAPGGGGAAGEAAGEPAGADDGVAATFGAIALSPDDVATILRAPAMAAGLDDATVVVSAAAAADAGVASGDLLTLTVTAADEQGVQTPVGVPTRLTAVVTSLPGGLLVTPGVLARMDATGPANQIWARLSDVSAAGAVVPRIEDALSGSAVQISGAAVERAQYQRIIDALLAVVISLLGVAVVIALIGVANTLSLSVLERRRESATLRALGLSRRQLRGTFAIEGMLISGVGAAAGVVLGTLYGWAGTATVLGSFGAVRLEIAWVDLALVVVVALAAGLLASVLPGRAAARISPVAALAEQ